MSLLEKVKKTIKETLPEVAVNGDVSGQSGEMLWKVSNNALITGSRLIVGASQEALFVRGGMVEEIFGPGTYDLKTSNIPVLKSFISMIYGGGDPNQAQVWFVNKSVMTEIPWGTPSPIMLQDETYGFKITLNVRCNGAISVRILDSMRLFVELAGQTGSFSVENFNSAIKSLLISRLRKAIGDMMKEKQYTYDQLQNNITDLEQPILDSVAEEIARFGVSAEACYVRGLSVVDDEGWRLYRDYQQQYGQLHMDAMRKRTLDIDLEAERMQKFGIDYRSDRQLDILQTAAANEGNPMVNAPIGLGVGLGAGKTIADQMQGAATGAVPAPAPSAAAAACPGCGQAVAGGAKFCPECGYTLARICAGCKHVDSGSSKFCPECGKKHAFCPACGVDNEDGAAACAKCGQPLATVTACPQCQVPVEPGQKFCPECGAKLN